MAAVPLLLHIFCELYPRSGRITSNRAVTTKLLVDCYFVGPRPRATHLVRCVISRLFCPLFSDSFAFLTRQAPSSQILPPGLFAFHPLS